MRDALVLRLDDGRELRYHDAEDMGKIYLTLDLGKVPTFLDLGPEANDSDLTLGSFRQRLRRHPGEIKGILPNRSSSPGSATRMRTRSAGGRGFTRSGDAPA